MLLLVEVADTSADDDRQVKLPLYARAGVPAVWLIDRALPGVVEVDEGPSPHGFQRNRLGAPGRRGGRGGEDGFADGGFQPLGTATRAQAAKVLAMVLRAAP